MKEQRLGAREPERGNEQTSTDRLESHSMLEIEQAIAEIERKYKTESERESLCTQKDLRDSSKTLFFVLVVLRLNLSSHL